MPDLIHVVPLAEQRQPFAAWAVAQTPKIRTVGPNAFAVPAALFTQVPESVLVGALVDGHRYISPEEDHQQAQPALAAAEGPEVVIPVQCRQRSCQLADVSGLVELLGVATPDALSAPRGHLEDAALPGSVDEPETEGVVCQDCGRSFKSTRGRDTHHRQVHKG